MLKCECFFFFFLKSNLDEVKKSNNKEKNNCKIYCYQIRKNKFCTILVLVIYVHERFFYFFSLQKIKEKGGPYIIITIRGEDSQ